MKIYTKTGDQGNTSLYDGSKSLQRPPFVGMYRRVGRIEFGIMLPSTNPDFVVRFGCVVGMCIYTKKMDGWPIRPQIQSEH